MIWNTLLRHILLMHWTYWIKVIKCAVANVGEEWAWCNGMRRVLLWGMNNVPHLFFKPGILEFVGPRLTSSPKCSYSSIPALLSIHSSKAANMQNISTLDSSPGAIFHFEHAFLAPDVVIFFIFIKIYAAVAEGLTHWGRVTQICVFTLQLCKTDDANLRF